MHGKSPTPTNCATTSSNTPFRQRDIRSRAHPLRGSAPAKLAPPAVEAGLESTEIDIVDAALSSVSSPHSNPSTSPSFIIDTFVMLVLGIILAFLLESLDTGLRSVAEIESRLRPAFHGPHPARPPHRRPTTPTLSSVMRNLTTLSSPKSQFSEAFRALRTSLLLSVAGGEPQGHSAHQRHALRRQDHRLHQPRLRPRPAQRRVLLVDADLRRPTVHHRFGLNGKIGLTSVLTGSVSLQEAIQTLPGDAHSSTSSSAAPSRRSPPKCSVPTPCAPCIEQCKGVYTHIVMDSPAAALRHRLGRSGSRCRCRRDDRSPRQVQQARHASRSRPPHPLRCAPVTGIVLNAVDLNSPEYYAYYGYYGYTGYAAAGVDSAGWDSRADGKEWAANGKDRDSTRGDSE